MVLKIGLLPQWNIEQLPFAYTIYKRDDAAGRELSLRFKRTFSIDVRIKFVGVWYVMQLSIKSPSHTHVGTPYNPSGGFQRTCHSAERTMPLRISVMPWLWTNAGSSLSHPSTKAENPSTATRIQNTFRRLQWTRYQILRFRELVLSWIPNPFAAPCSSQRPTSKKYSSPAPTAVRSGSPLYDWSVIYGCSFRCRGRICEERHTSQSRPHSPSMDDQGMFRASYRNHFRRAHAQARGWTGHQIHLQGTQAAPVLRLSLVGARWH